MNIEMVGGEVIRDTKLPPTHSISATASVNKVLIVVDKLSGIGVPLFKIYWGILQPQGRWEEKKWQLCMRIATHDAIPPHPIPLYRTGHSRNIES